MLRNMYKTYKAFAYAYAIASITAFTYECIRLSLKEAKDGRTATSTTVTA